MPTDLKMTDNASVLKSTVVIVMIKPTVRKLNKLILKTLLSISSPIVWNFYSFVSSFNAVCVAEVTTAAKIAIVKDRLKITFDFESVQLSCRAFRRSGDAS